MGELCSEKRRRSLDIDTIERRCVFHVRRGISSRDRGEGGASSDEASFQVEELVEVAAGEVTAGVLLDTDKELAVVRDEVCAFGAREGRRVGDKEAKAITEAGDGVNGDGIVTQFGESEVEGASMVEEADTLVGDGRGLHGRGKTGRDGEIRLSAREFSDDEGLGDLLEAEHLCGLTGVDATYGKARLRILLDQTLEGEDGESLADGGAPQARRPEEGGG